MKQKSKKDRWLHVRLSQEEYEEIKAQFNSATCRKLSDFIRKKLLSQLIVGSYRSASQDAIIEELAALKAELSAAANNFNQAVRKLHTLSKIKEFEHWLISYELDRRSLIKQVEKTSDFISKKAAEW